jgi:hypothetical protein
MKPEEESVCPRICPVLQSVTVSMSSMSPNVRDIPSEVNESITARKPNVVERSHALLEIPCKRNGVGVYREEPEKMNESIPTRNTEDGE